MNSTITPRAALGPLALVALFSAPVSAQAPVLNPANGHWYQAVATPGGQNWDTSRLQAAAMSHLGVMGHLATVNDLAENLFIYNQVTTLTAHQYYIGGFQDMTAPNYVEPAGGWAWVTGEPWSFEAWFTPGEPNDYLGVEHYLCYDHGVPNWNDVEVNYTWNAGFIVEYDVGGPTPGSGYCFGDATGASCPCSNFGFLGEGCANSGGSGAVLVGSGTPSIATDTFQLDITGVPGAKPGLVLKGDNQVAIPAGDGILCTSGGSVRSQVQITVAGATTFTEFNPGGVGSGGSFGGVSNAVGMPTYFQFWYRDPANVCGGGFNFTNGWEVTYGL